jgi:Ala-tRNA(Pro) deacylase
MPPLGPLYGQRVFIDESLTGDDEVVFNAGTHVDAVRMRYDSLVKLTAGVVTPFGSPMQGSRPRPVHHH